MAHSLSMIPSQQMRLEQRLTPQLIQSMEILQLPLLALEARVREELEQNPVLEEAEVEIDREPQEQKDEPLNTEANRAEAESFERLERMSREMDFDSGDLPYGRAARGEGERDVKIDAMANTESRGESLRDSLMRQWGLVETDDATRAAGMVLIDWMDDDGYLRMESEHRPSNENGESDEATPLIMTRTPEQTAHLMEEIAWSQHPPIDAAVLQKALELIQTLEPAGVGARDLTECLLIQLRAIDVEDTLCEELVRHHLVTLAKNNFPAVAKATGRSIEDIRAALKVIGKLNHHPGLLCRSNDVPKVSPDIIVEYADQGDGYTVKLARGNSPRLRISAQYREMLSDKDADKETREYIKKRIESAGVIIDAIAYRRQRLLEIAKVILERQREFFDFGPQFMNALRMRDLADEFNCDPSTISRTVDGKYLQTPRGIYPLRMFFTSGPRETDGGDGQSWNSIKHKVKEIIEAEDKRRPLTDDEITQKLSEASGTPVARRTVAKYRAQLGIPSNRERKVH